LSFSLRVGRLFFFPLPSRVFFSFPLLSTFLFKIDISVVSPFFFIIFNGSLNLGFSQSMGRPARRRPFFFSSVRYARPPDFCREKAGETLFMGVAILSSSCQINFVFSFPVKRFFIKTIFLFFFLILVSSFNGGFPPKVPPPLSPPFPPQASGFFSPQCATFPQGQLAFSFFS